MKNISTGRLLPNKNLESEKEKINPSVEKISKPLKEKMWFTIALCVLLVILAGCYISYITGDGLLNLLNFFDTNGFEKKFLIFMAIAIVLLGIKMDIVSWGTIRFLVIVCTITMFIHILGASIWPSWNPRNWAKNVVNSEIEENKSTKGEKDYQIYEKKFSPYPFLATRGNSITDHWIKRDNNSSQFSIDIDWDKESFFIKTRSGRIISSDDYRKGGMYISEDFKIYATSKTLNLKFAVL